MGMRLQCAVRFLGDQYRVSFSSQPSHKLLVECVLRQERGGKDKGKKQYSEEAIQLPLRPT